MPEISRFFGIVIYMYYKDHPVPHFHAKFDGKKIKIAISDLSILSGGIPATALKLVMDWAGKHQDELMEAWEQAVIGVRPNKIPPLE